MKPSTAKYFHDAGMLMLGAITKLQERVELLERQMPAPAQKRMTFAIQPIVQKDSSRIIKGIASTPSVDRAGDIVEPLGCRWKLPVPLLANHDHARLVGTLTKVHLSAAGVHIEARVAEGTQEADNAWTLIRQGVLNSMSIGFIGEQSEPLANGGRRFSRWTLLELSLVGVPANPNAIISEVAA